MHIAFVVDTPNLEPIEPILDELEGLPVLAWIAASAFIALGPSVIHHLRLAGFDAYLDLRLCGEAESIRRSIEAVRRQGALGVTVDLGSGAAAARAARQAAGRRLEVIGVPAALDGAEVLAERVQIAVDARLDGVLVTGPNAAMVPAGMPLFARSDSVVPGAVMLVVADRILASPDPRAACEALLMELG